jgi:small GTP-binding protein
MEYGALGIFASVDAGKTTLCETILKKADASGQRNAPEAAVFDSDGIEKRRGITVFSEQADISLGERTVTLIDTPGHVDFTSEAERAMAVIDAAVVVVSAPDGVQPHTLELWDLLGRRGVPAAVFVTKTDMQCPGRKEVMDGLREAFGECCIDAGEDDVLPEASSERLADSDDILLEKYLEQGSLSISDIRGAFIERKAFPAVFGSGLTGRGVDRLLHVLGVLMPHRVWGGAFSARVYKIARDPSGARLTFLRVTGGQASVRMPVGPEQGKITGIRRYRGSKYESAEILPAGACGAVTGLSSTYPGQGLGVEEADSGAETESVFRYSAVPLDGTDPRELYEKLTQLGEEDPLLDFSWDQEHGEIGLSVLGNVQTEVLEELIERRFSTKVSIEKGHVLFKETISDRVEGVGHFEPLRHYAEVHVILEPGKPGSGITVRNSCPESALPRQYQQAAMDALSGYTHRGVLTGAPLTDVVITLASGKSSQVHTDGGDMRQAALRAVRQGLMQAESVLLEPSYSYVLKVPQDQLGRAVNDIRKMTGTFSIEESSGGMSTLTGTCPVRKMSGYSEEVASYTGGRGSLVCAQGGYAPCSDAAEIISASGYDPEADTENTPDSVFCTHGAGFIVSWRDVPRYMHAESVLGPGNTGDKEPSVRKDIDYEDVEELMNREFGPIRRRQYGHAAESASRRRKREEEQKRSLLILDGYNVLFASEELKRLAEKSLPAAREKLIDIMADYHGFTGTDVMIVFDAYRNSDQTEKRSIVHGIEVLYTDKDQTADAYIERTAVMLSKSSRVRIVTSDNLVRTGISASGISAVSSGIFLLELARMQEQIDGIIEKYHFTPGQKLGDLIDEEELREWRRKTNS